MVNPTHEQLTEIADLVDRGKVRVSLQKTYTLDEAAQAQTELERDHSIGKRVLKVA